eukprot:1245778-Pyramimonas_sp.AAC.1
MQEPSVNTSMSSGTAKGLSQPTWNRAQLGCQGGLPGGADASTNGPWAKSSPNGAPMLLASVAATLSSGDG